MEHGELIAIGRGSDLITIAKFGDFKLHIEFKNGKSTNSGVYLRGRYELQIETDEAAQTGEFHTGGIYGFLPQIQSNLECLGFGRRLMSLLSGVA